MKTLKLILAALCFSALSVSYSQDVYTLNPDKSILTVSGTSNVHEWEMQVKKPEGTVMFNRDGDGLNGISDLKIKVKSSRITSGNRIMDNKTLDALKAEKYTYIQLTLSDVNEFSSSGNMFHGTINGYLEIAGRKNTVTIPFSGSVKNNNEITVNGSKRLRMTDFDITPPTALAGTMKTGDEVMVEFNVTLNPNSYMSHK